MADLDDAEHRTTIHLLCLAGEQDGDQRGTLPAMPERVLAVEVARGDVALLRRTLAHLSDLHILAPLTDGGWCFINWEKRNADTRKPSDQAAATRERKQRQRANERAARVAAQPPLDGVTPCHAPVTPQEEEQELDTSATADGAVAPRVVVRESVTPPVDLTAERRSRRTAPDPTEAFQVATQASAIIGFDWEAVPQSGRNRMLAQISRCLKEQDPASRVDLMLDCARYIAADRSWRHKSPTLAAVVKEFPEWLGRGRPARPGQVAAAPPVRELRAAAAAAADEPFTPDEQQRWLAGRLRSAERSADQYPSERSSLRVAAYQAALLTVQDGAPRTLGDLEALVRLPGQPAAARSA